MADARIVRSTDGKSYGNQWLFKEGSLTGGQFDFLVGHIDYLAGPALHIHHEQVDSFFVLEGILTMQIGDDIVELGPGDFATAPPGVPHTFSNTHKDQPPVKLVNLMTPGGLDRHFQDIALAEGLATDPAKRAELEEACGLTVVGPTLAEKLGLS
jgi:mannose-6-phosphate isomerase-like protein (cupin superfamily)